MCDLDWEILSLLWHSWIGIPFKVQHCILHALSTQDDNKKLTHTHIAQQGGGGGGTTKHESLDTKKVRGLKNDSTLFLRFL